MSVDGPSAAKSNESGWLGKADVELLIKKWIDTTSASAACADVTLGKNFKISEEGLDAEIDEIQEWLVSHGITTITFRMAQSYQEGPVVREYRNGVITKDIFRGIYPTDE
jgi:hypothetical protein